MISKHGTFNRLLQSLRAPDYENVAFWVHDIRRRRTESMRPDFKQSFNQMASDQYYEKLSNERLMGNEMFVTMIYRPVVEGKRFQAKSADVRVIKAEQDAAISKMTELGINLESALSEYGPYRLSMYENEKGVVFSEVLELFGYILNNVNERVPVLSAPAHSYMAVSRHFFSAKTGDFIVRTPEGKNRYGAILNIKEYPSLTYPGILNNLKYLGADYVVTHSFTPMGRQVALKSLERTKGMLISSGDKSISQIVDLDRAMDDVSSGNFVLGSYHFTITLYADSLDELNQILAMTRSELSNAGFVASKEDLAIAASFYAQLPTNWQYRTRTANISSLNFLGLSPLHNFSTGKRDQNPWGECVSVLQTINGQPFYFNFHATNPGENSLGEKAIGNTMVIGKSGTGKTALINFLLSQVQKYNPIPTIFFFDKDRGAEIFVRACGGNYLALDNGKPTGFNPLQCEKNEANIQFLSELVKMLCGKSAYTAQEEQDIHRAVLSVLDSPIKLRRMVNLQKVLPNMGDDSLYERIRKWTESGSLGWVFDNPEDTIDLTKASIIGFDYTEMIDNPEVRNPVIRYLLHRLEGLIDGRPLIYVMDEFWKILEGEGGLKEFAKNKQKTIRKQNGLGIFATQSPEDALRSDISAALIEQTATLILLPNPNADREDYINGLKITEAEFKVLTQLDERSRCFLIKQGHHSAVCQLNLRGLDDVLSVISASTDNIEVMDQVMRHHGQRLGKPINDLLPEEWLGDFYKHRKGSGKAKGNGSNPSMAIGSDV